MDPLRRALLQAGTAALAAAALPARAATATAMTTTAIPAPATFDPVPPIPPPAARTPGKPGDFDFLAGEWRIANRSLVEGRWLAYEGEATVTGILAGVASIEELRIPARRFSGMGLRLLDVEKRLWSDFWVNAKSGVLATPGAEGSFEGGVGIFPSGEGSDLACGLWDRIGPRACRWRQVTSADGGRTWRHDWIMDWTRA